MRPTTLSTETAFSLRLRRHYKAARVNCVMSRGGTVVVNSLEVSKGRCKYRYAFDGDTLSLSFEKGKEVVRETYPLAELSPMFGYWKGYPLSTKKNLRASALFLLAAGSTFLFFGTFWLFGLLFVFEAMRRLINEAEFLLPGEATVISYKDGRDCLYMQRASVVENRRVEFEMALKIAIEERQA